MLLYPDLCSSYVDRGAGVCAIVSGFVCLLLMVAEIVSLLLYMDRSDGSVDRGARVRAFIPRFL